MLRSTSLLAVTIALITSVNAIPITRAVEGRAPVERIYIANCGSPTAWTKSQVGYFDNNAEFEEMEPPVAVYDPGFVVTFEGKTVKAPLSNGDVFTSHLQANAASQAALAPVGNATTTTELWQCRKRFGDDWGWPLAWQLSDGTNCYTLYECHTS
ncbi:hypothetical protein GQ53DRAFT_842430 [Thozetella sp. PMI_491]|nr:hypothetical protein GQ53DRAFT_842430 [Thozetella sp. PMI_491]